MLIRASTKAFSVVANGIGSPIPGAASAGGILVDASPRFAAIPRTGSDVASSGGAGGGWRPARGGEELAPCIPAKGASAFLGLAAREAPTLGAPDKDKTDRAAPRGASTKGGFQSPLLHAMRPAHHEQSVEGGQALWEGRPKQGAQPLRPNTTHNEFQTSWSGRPTPLSKLYFPPSRLPTVSASPLPTGGNIFGPHPSPLRPNQSHLASSPIVPEHNPAPPPSFDPQAPNAAGYPKTHFQPHFR